MADQLLFFWKKNILQLKPYSSSVLLTGGIILMGTGGYFILLRPSLLPEDIVYMQVSPEIIKTQIPGLTNWLNKVFYVLGSYILTCGLLTCYISLTSFKQRERGSFAIVAISGLTSIATMSVVNFIINSDFKWLLLVFTLPWVFALILYRFHK